MLNSEYWNSRARKFGHTGWANYSIYAFDQLARLEAVESILLKLQTGRELALDFGTGSGNFARMLSKIFKKVIAFDTSKEVIAIGKVQNEDISNIQFNTGDSAMDLEIGDGSVDLILSVTVLGHLMDGNLLHSHLHFFNKKLSGRGRIIALEYTPLNKMPPAEYQNFLTFSEWQEAFSTNGLLLDECYGFYSPSEASCTSYDEYRNVMIVKVLRLFQYFNWARKGLNIAAGKIVKENHDFFWPHKSDDLLKIMVYKKTDLDR